MNLQGYRYVKTTITLCVDCRAIVGSLRWYFKRRDHVIGLIDNLADEIKHLQDCKSVLQDLYTQCKGVQPDQVDAYTWLRIKLLLQETI